MKAVLQAVALSSAVALPAFALAATPLHGEPGYHGPLQVSAQQRPDLIRQNPELVRPLSAAEMARPLYLHVPRHQIWRWSRYCRDYGACGRPAYFVTQRWYESVYIPQYREERRRDEIVQRKSSGKKRGLEF